MKSWRGVILTFGGLLFVAMGATGAEATEGAKAGKVTTITGEVVDTRCYIGDDQDQKGPKHRACAVRCAKGGAALAILQDKTNDLYLIMPKEDGENPNTSFMELIAERVMVNGKVFEVGGMRAIIPQVIKKVK